MKVHYIIVDLHETTDDAWVSLHMLKSKALPKDKKTAARLQVLPTSKSLTGEPWKIGGLTGKSFVNGNMKGIHNQPNMIHGSA